MIQFWLRKQNRLFKQSTALLVAAALLCSILLPPFASAKSAQAFTLRTQSQCMVEQRSPELEEEVKQTLERGIEFFQNLFKRTDTPKWMVALVKIVYAPLSAETWKLELFRIKQSIENHHPRNPIELQQLKNNLIALFSSMAVSHIYFTQFFNQKLNELFQADNSLETIAIALGGSFISALLSLFPIQILAHSIISIYRAATGGMGLTQRNPTVGEKNIDSVSIRSLYQWDSEEQGVRNVLKALKKYKPKIVERYANIHTLSPEEIYSLKEEIYKITQGHFEIWELGRAIDIRSTLYFGGSHITALEKVFPQLELNALGFQLQWADEEGNPDERLGIQSIEYVLSKEKPDLLEKYKNINTLSLEEITSLKEDIYKITQGHFQVWGLGGAMNKKGAPYFGGSYMTALRKVFPQLDLNPLGFQLQWKDEVGNPDERLGIKSVKYVLSKEKPDIMEQYQKIEILSIEEINSLKEEIYKITAGHFQGWGLVGAMTKRIAPYFDGSYITALRKVFPQLELNPLGFQLQWTDEEGNPNERLGIESVKYVLSKEKPDIMEQYQKIKTLSIEEINSLKEDIYKITQGHFQVWGMRMATDKRGAPYFDGSYITALLKVFDHPRLSLTEQGFKDYRKSHWEIKYSWGGGSGIQYGIENVRDAIEINKPELIRTYHNLHQITELERERLKEDIYKITQGHFQVWGLSRAMNKRGAPYFGGSYITALRKVFPQLDLNPLGFQLQWIDEEGNPDERLGIQSVEYVLSKEKPDIMEQYKKIEILSPEVINSLKEKIYKITQGYFKVWGLSGVMIKKSAPYFGGSHITALQKVFPQLDLNPLGFQLQWADEEGNPDERLGIQSVKYVLSKEKPDIMEQYKKIITLSSEEINSLKEEIYKITFGHFHVWGLGGAMTKSGAPYFGGSHITTLRKVFPQLDLNPLGFQLQWADEEGNPDETLGIQSVKYILSKETPELMERYQLIDALFPEEINSLKEEIYKITQGHFKVWGLGGAMTKRETPYFSGSYITALLKVFDDSHLNLKKEGFLNNPGSEKFEEETYGGISPIVKEWSMNQFSFLPSRNYDRWFASLFENTPAYLLSLMVGLPMVLVTHDFTLSFYASYISTWSYIFIAAHFIPDSRGIRAPPINIGLAGIISVVNLSLPFLLPHIFSIFAIPVPLLIPSVIVGSYLSHQIVNLVVDYLRQYQKSKESQSQLKEIMRIRKELGEHPFTTLFYALTHKIVQRNSSPQENLILIHLDQFENIESEGALQYAMQGIVDYIVLNESKNVKVRFVMNSEDQEKIAQTLTQRYPILEGLVLSSVPSPEEAINKSKGYRIAYVVTRAPEMWKGLAKNLVVLLSGGTELILKGKLAQELRGLIKDMGFIGADGSHYSWGSGELTIKEKNLKTEDLEKLRKPELFKMQA